jgi:two-component system, NarL family, response regulator NreC
MNAIRVLLADDHAVLRDSLEVFLGLHEDLNVVGAACDGADTITQALRLQPDVLVLDLGMPNLGGLEVTRRLKRDLPGCKIVVLSQHQDPDYVLPVLRAGADGYTLKKAGGSEVVLAIQAVHRGEAYLHPAVAQLVLDLSIRSEESWPDPLDSLTQREREVLALIGQGRTNQQIATTLSISRKTVDKHRANLLRKLQVGSRSELIRYAVEQKIIPPGSD